MLFPKKAMYSMPQTCKEDYGLGEVKHFSLILAKLDTSEGFSFYALFCA